MDIRDSLSSGEQIRFIASTVTEKNASKVQDYEKICVFLLTEKFRVLSVNVEYTMSLSYLW